MLTTLRQAYILIRVRIRVCLHIFRIRVYWSDPDPVFEIWPDTDPVFKICSDLESGPIRALKFKIPLKFNFFAVFIGKSYKTVNRLILLYCDLYCIEKMKVDLFY